MGSGSESRTEKINIDEMCDKEELYRRGEEFLREVFRREKKVKYETGKRIIEGVRREYGERCLNILTDLNVDYDFLEEKGEDAKAKMRELFKPLSDIKIAGRYVFKEVAENIDAIESKKEGTFEVDYEHEYEEVKKEIERIRRENERQRRDAIGLIEKKYDLIEVGEEEKIRVGKEEAEGIIERYCDEESERRECQRILDGIEKGSIKIEDRRDYCSGEYYKKRRLMIRY